MSYFNYNDNTTVDMSIPDEFLRRCGNVDTASTVDEADFTLAHGCQVWRKSPIDKMPL